MGSKSGLSVITHCIYDIQGRPSDVPLITQLPSGGLLLDGLYITDISNITDEVVQRLERENRWRGVRLTQAMHRRECEQQSDAEGKS